MIETRQIDLITKLYGTWTRHALITRKSDQRFLQINELVVRNAVKGMKNDQVIGIHGSVDKTLKTD